MGIPAGFFSGKRCRSFILLWDETRSGEAQDSGGNGGGYGRTGPAQSDVALLGRGLCGHSRGEGRAKSGTDPAAWIEGRSRAAADPSGRAARGQGNGAGQREPGPGADGRTGRRRGYVRTAAGETAQKRTRPARRLCTRSPGGMRSGGGEQNGKRDGTGKAAGGGRAGAA